MKSTRKILLELAVVLLALSAVASLALAQNPIRRAPTAADWAALAKLPDFTGVWEVAGEGRNRGVAPQAGPSLTPEYAAERDALRASAREDNETANCLPAGMPGIMGQPYPMEFLITPGKVTIVIEAYTQVRHIYTDGRTLPEDPDLKFHGTSVGRWEGDTLVVDTVGFSPLTQLDRGVVAPLDLRQRADVAAAQRCAQRQHQTQRCRREGGQQPDPVRELPVR